MVKLSNKIMKIEILVSQKWLYIIIIKTYFKFKIRYNNQIVKSNIIINCKINLKNNVNNYFNKINKINNF